MKKGNRKLVLSRVTLHPLAVHGGAPDDPPGISESNCPSACQSLAKRCYRITDLSCNDPGNPEYQMP